MKIIHLQIFASRSYVSIDVLICVSRPTNFQNEKITHASNDYLAAKGYFYPVQRYLY